MNNHVTDLATSRKLKEIGCPQNDSLFYWYTYSQAQEEPKILGNRRLAIAVKNCSYSLVSEECDRKLLKDSWDSDNLLCSAYLLSELIEILGNYTFTLRKKWLWGQQYAYIASVIPGPNGENCHGDTPLEAVSSLILKLHSEGILKFNQNQE